MGLGGTQKVRKEFQKNIAGKTNWKDDVESPNAAYTMITQIRKNLAGDPNGKYIEAAYAGRQIRTLEEYIKTHGGKTFKEWSKTRGT